MDTRSSITALLLLGTAACTGSPDVAKPEPEKAASLENPNLSEAAKQLLKELEQLFKVGHPSYAARRKTAVEAEPRLAPWLAKAVVGYAVGDFDRLKQRGLVPHQLAGNPAFADRTFFRGRRELVELGDPGRRAIVRYLMRSRYGELRQLARYMLRAHAVADVLPLLTIELAAGALASQRAALQLLADYGDEDGAFRLLEQTTKAADWQLRGTATRALATALRKRGAKSAAASLWRVFEQDRDEFVRRQALLALGDLGDADQVRPLVAVLARLMQGERLAEAKAAGEALRLLTGRSYGTSLQQWRAWLGAR